jgi:hypothetical protein
MLSRPSPTTAKPAHFSGGSRDSAAAASRWLRQTASLFGLVLPGDVLCSLDAQLDVCAGLDCALRPGRDCWLAQLRTATARLGDEILVHATGAELFLVARDIHPSCDRACTDCHCRNADDHHCLNRRSMAARADRRVSVPATSAWATYATELKFCSPTNVLHFQ